MKQIHPISSKSNEEHRDPMEPKERLWTKGFIIITISYLLLFMSLQMLLSPFPSYVKQQFAPDSFTLSLVTGVFALAAIAARFAAVGLLKRLHRNTVLTAGILIAAAATAVYSFAPTIGVLLILRVLYGIGFGLASTVLPTLVSQIIPRRRLGEGIGYFGLSTSLAMSFGPLIGLWLLDSKGFPALTIAGTLAAILVLPLLFLTRSVPPQPVRVLPDEREKRQQQSASYRALMLPTLLNVLMSLTYGGLLGFLALYGQEIGMGQIGLFFLFNAATVLLIRPVSGRMFDSKGPAAVLIPAAVLVFAALILLSYTRSIWMLAASALLYGLGFGAIQPSLQAWMLRMTPSERHSTANSMFYNSIDFGVAIGSMLLGVIASHSNYSVMYRSSAVVMLGFLLLFLIFGVVNRKAPVTSSPSPDDQQSA